MTIRAPSKNLKKGLKVKGLTPYERSAMEQMLGQILLRNGQGRTKRLMRLKTQFWPAGSANDEIRAVQVNIAQINIAEGNYAVGAQQLETYFREGGTQKPALVKLAMTPICAKNNRQAAVPWAHVMLDRG